MSNENLTNIERIFHSALELAPDDREPYLAGACNGDKSLYAEVSSLISAFTGREEFIEEPALSFGLRVLSESSQQSMIGKTIGVYQVVCQLGKGGMGEVYLAEDTKLNRKVALKFLSQQFVGDNWAKRQLVKEAQASAMLDHPNICTVYGIEELDGHTFIVMQYVDGETLAALIKKELPQPALALHFARQIIGALAEAHSHGIIHRDMKPKNIMVTPNHQIKVLDFGLAKTMRQKKGSALNDDSISHLSQTGLLQGTVAYMSPEQLRGERLDFRTDIFSLGTVLLEMITGVNPFARRSEAETISAILTADPSGGNGNSVNFKPLTKIAYTCLQKNREDRYHSASELLLEIEDGQQNKDRQGRTTLTKIAWIAAAVFIVSLVFAFISFWPLRTSSSRDNALASKAAEKQNKFLIAILPITYADESKPDDYLPQGLTTSLITRFSAIADWRIVPYTAVAAYTKRLQNPLQVGRSLHADAILTGKLTQQGDEFELESQLIKTADGSEIWTGKQVVSWSTIFQVQDDLASRVASSLQIRFPAESNSPAIHGTTNVEAFRHYMRGRYYWNNRTEENVRRAIDSFKTARDLDPAYPQAWAGLANSYVLLSSVGFGKTPTEEVMPRALAAAKEAIALDEHSVEAHTSLGIVALRYSWDWQRAEEEFTRAIQIDPDYAPAHYWYSHLLLIKGHAETAVAESELSKVLDPSPHSVMNSCRILSMSGHYDKAVACYDNLIAENPDYNHAKYLRAFVYLRSGREAEALEAFQILYAKDPALTGAAFGYALGKAGRTSDAKRILKEMEALGKERYLPPMEFAIINIGLGDKDRAFEWLEKGYKERFAHLPYITVDPIYESLHSDPRYASLLQRLNLTPPSQR
jgi:eukaryotic-like serine/threonine-protein kinase